MGALNFKASIAGYAPIGGSEGCSYGTITINGGRVTAKGGRHAAGIGGGNGASAGQATINGGTVTATGGSASDD